MPYINRHQQMLPPYRHILLGVDFSDQSQTIARKAKQIAENFEAKLSVVHVLDNIPMPDTPYGTVIPFDICTNYALLEDEKSKLQSICDAIGVNKSNRWMIWGNPKEEITRLAAKEQADLIVVGSHGRHGLSLLLGSTANDVLHSASCDVMAIRLIE